MVDRIACPWLIKKFVDKEAQFIFVPEEEVLKVAEKEGAIPFDVKGVGSRAIDSFNKYDISVITGTNDTINNLTEAILPDSQMVDRLWKEHEGFEHGKKD